jgi:hypothetical protein
MDTNTNTVYTLRCYNTVAGRPVLTHTEQHIDTSSDAFWSNFRAAGRRYDGVEAVWDGEVTDWDGDCPYERSRTREDDDSWKQELAMEAGMLHGIDAYNEAMGFDLDDSEF